MSFISDRMAALDLLALASRSIQSSCGAPTVAMTEHDSDNESDDDDDEDKDTKPSKINIDIDKKPQHSEKLASMVPPRPHPDPFGDAQVFGMTSRKKRMLGSTGDRYTHDQEKELTAFANKVNWQFRGPQKEATVTFCAQMQKKYPTREWKTNNIIRWGERRRKFKKPAEPMCKAEVRHAWRRRGRRPH